MTRFVDASTIVGGYARRGDQAREWERLRRGDMAVSRLSEVEVASAFARLARESAITDDERDVATRAFLDDLTRWIVVELTPDVTSRARDLLVRHPLRAGEAIQLASALVLHTRLSRALEAFVTSDRRLLATAPREGLAVVNVRPS